MYKKVGIKNSGRDEKMDISLKNKMFAVPIKK